MIAELVVANRSRKRPRIVIMANRDKVEMEDEISAKVADLGNTRIICRSGDPTDLYDLSLVTPQSARSIVILSPEGEDGSMDDADSSVIKTILALVHDPRRRAEPYRIAAEIRDTANVEVARVVGGREAQLVLADELIGRIVVHSSRQAGLSAVYSELLDFEGCEIYTVEQQGLVGKTFGESLMAYDASTLIGIVAADGSVELNPDMSRRFVAGDRAVIIAEDDAAIQIKAPGALPDQSQMRSSSRAAAQPERVLLLGWNRRAPIIAYELSRYVEPGSVLTIAADTPTLEDDVAALSVANTNLQIFFGRTDITSRKVLEGLDIGSYDHVLVLGYSDLLAPQPTDTRTLVTLLHLRKIAETTGRRVKVVSEMVDVRNRELAEVTRADDFVVSNKLVSLMLAQASENDALTAIFDDLLDEEGSELYMRPASDYVALGVPVNFYTVTETARLRGEVAIGYHRPRPDAAANGILINPAKSATEVYSTEDRLIILARD
ncbi:CASTOR/POLLUX-related putative ion channel [Devosia riboflavina]